MGSILAGHVVFAQRLVPPDLALVAVQREAKFTSGSHRSHFIACKAIRKREFCSVYQYIARTEAVDELRVAGSLTAEIAFLRMQGAQLNRTGSPAVAHYGADKLARNHTRADAREAVALHLAGGAHVGIHDTQVFDSGILAAAEETYLVIVFARHGEVLDHVTGSVKTAIEPYLRTANVGIHTDGPEVRHATHVNVGRQTAP